MPTAIPKSIAINNAGSTVGRKIKTMPKNPTMMEKIKNQDIGRRFFMDAIKLKSAKNKGLV